MRKDTHPTRTIRMDAPYALCIASEIRSAAIMSAFREIGLDIYDRIRSGIPESHRVGALDVHSRILESDWFGVADAEFRLTDPEKRAVDLILEEAIANAGPGCDPETAPHTSGAELERARKLLNDSWDRSGGR